MQKKENRRIGYNQKNGNTRFKFMKQGKINRLKTTSQEDIRNANQVQNKSIGMYND